MADLLVDLPVKYTDGGGAAVWQTIFLVDLPI